VSGDTVAEEENGRKTPPARKGRSSEPGPIYSFFVENMTSIATATERRVGTSIIRTIMFSKIRRLTGYRDRFALRCLPTHNKEIISYSTADASLVSHRNGLLRYSSKCLSPI
jgi:hypothetical protein